MQGIVFLSISVWSLLVMIHGMDIVLEDIQWLLALKGESQAATCSRVNLLPINMDNVNVTWDFTTLSYVVNSQLNLSITDAVNSYQGISGCCTASLWCEDSKCFTQSYGENYVNFGWIPTLPNAVPVFTCISSTVNNTLSVNRVDISTTAVLSIYGSSFGVENDALIASVNGYHCKDAELCNCLTCTSPDFVCPIGSMCARVSSTVGSLCLKACAGMGDESCPCGYVCSNMLNVFGDAVSLCVPPSSNVLTACRSNGQSALQCEASNLYYESYVSVSPTFAPTSSPSPSSLQANFSLQVDTQDSLFYSQTSLKTCTRNQDCFDNDACTVNTCSTQGRCVLTPVEGCGSIHYQIQESYTPYTYHVYTSQRDTMHADEVYDFLLNQTTPRTLPNPTSSFSFTLPFDVIFFGAKASEMRVYGSGAMALPPYPPCGTAECGLFKTSTNVLAPFYSPDYSTLTVRIYTQTPSSSSPFAKLQVAGYSAYSSVDESSFVHTNALFSSNVTAVHLLFNATINATSTSSYLVSVYADSSIRFTYFNDSENSAAADRGYQLGGVWRDGGEYVGLWGPSATDVTDTNAALRYQREELAPGLGVGLGEGAGAVFFCPANRTACMPNVCVTSGSELEVQSNFSTSCLALNTSSPVYMCRWGGGVVADTQAFVQTAPGVSVAVGKLICPVPTLPYADATLVSVEVLTVYTTEEGLVSVRDGEYAKGVYAVGVRGGSNGEVTRTPLLVRYYPSSPPANCGCNALSLDGAECDSLGVCGGDSKVGGDCFATPWGGAYRDACSSCSAGLTGKVPVFTCPPASYSPLYGLLFQTLLVLSLICCVSVFTTTMSISIRRMIRRRRGEADMLWAEGDGVEFIMMERAGRAQNESMTAFELEAIGTQPFTHKLLAQCKKDRMHEPAAAQQSDTEEQVSGSGESEESLCPICLSEFGDGEPVRVLPPPCAHLFHPACIDPWLTRTPSCPLCKRNIKKLLFGEDETWGQGSDAGRARSRSGDTAGNRGRAGEEHAARRLSESDGDGTNIRDGGRNRNLGDLFSFRFEGGRWIIVGGGPAPPPAYMQGQYPANPRPTHYMPVPLPYPRAMHDHRPHHHVRQPPSAENPPHPPNVRVVTRPAPSNQDGEVVERRGDVYEI